MVPLQCKAAGKRHVQLRDASELLLLSDRPPGSDETSAEIASAGLVTHTQKTDEFSLEMQKRATRMITRSGR